MTKRSYGVMMNQMSDDGIHSLRFIEPQHWVRNAEYNNSILRDLKNIIDKFEIYKYINDDGKVNHLELDIFIRSHIKLEDNNGNKYSFDKDDMINHFITLKLYFMIIYYKDLNQEKYNCYLDHFIRHFEDGNNYLYVDSRGIPQYYKIFDENLEDDNLLIYINIPKLI